MFLLLFILLRKPFLSHTIHNIIIVGSLATEKLLQAHSQQQPVAAAPNQEEEEKQAA
jgi:hypothetical protein